MERTDGRAFNELRPVEIRRHFTESAPGSVLISAGKTMILCTASLVEQQPGWMTNPEQGWLTAEYRMLPGSTGIRKGRMDRPDGRATEIQRLIGRSLRSVFKPERLGPRTLYLDCDVLQADGGTRTLSITGAFIAMIDALAANRSLLPDPDKFPITDSVAAVSVGRIGNDLLLDLCYEEDFAADVDMNLVMTGSGRFVEIQGTGEGATFSEEELTRFLFLGRGGIAELTALQKAALADIWPFDSVVENTPKH